MPSIHELVASARQRLREAGLTGAEVDFDARILAECLLRWDAARYFADGTGQAPDGFAEAYSAAVDRRLRREPVSYITGRQEFWGLSFEVTPAVLIPRPETELIVEACLDHWPERHARLRVADACTGSGCLAIAIALERPAARISATDVSTAALAVARRNATRLGVGRQIAFVATDLLSGVSGDFDMIVSNPPYVPALDSASLPPEVVEHEPHVALFGGEDGLAVIRALVDQAASRLAPAGFLAFEFGFGQAGAVSNLIAATPGLALLELRQDLQGIPRTALVRRVA